MLQVWQQWKWWSVTSLFDPPSLRKTQSQGHFWTRTIQKQNRTTRNTKRRMQSRDHVATWPKRSRTNFTEIDPTKISNWKAKTANEPEMKQGPRALTLSLAQPKVGQIVDDTTCSCIQRREFFMQNWWKIIPHNARTTHTSFFGSLFEWRTLHGIGWGTQVLKIVFLDSDGIGSIQHTHKCVQNNWKKQCNVLLWFAGACHQSCGCVWHHGDGVKLDSVLTSTIGVHHILSHFALRLLLWSISCSTHNTNAECCRKENWKTHGHCAEFV